MIPRTKSPTVTAANAIGAYGASTPYEPRLGGVTRSVMRLTRLRIANWLLPSMLVPIPDMPVDLRSMRWANLAVYAVDATSFHFNLNGRVGNAKLALDHLRHGL